MKKMKKIRFLKNFWFTALIPMMGILVSCSSGNNPDPGPVTNPAGGDVSVPSICTPLNPHRGDEITCRGGDRNCVLFFGNQPATPTYNDNGTFVVRVPGALPSGNTVIAMVCGQDPRQTLGNINVSDATAGSGGSGGSTVGGGGGSGGSSGTGGSGGTGGPNFTTCRADRDCSGGASCLANRCVAASECTNDSQCTNPLRNMCSNNRCVGCVSNLDCSAGSICDSGSHACRGCTGNADCVGGGVCPTTTGTTTRVCTTCSPTLSCGENSTCRSSICFANPSAVSPRTEVTFARVSSSAPFDVLKIVADNVPGYMYFPVSSVSGTNCSAALLNTEGVAPASPSVASQVCEERLANCLNFRASDYPGVTACRVDVNQTVYKKMVLPSERVMRVYFDTNGIQQVVSSVISAPLLNIPNLTLTMSSSDSTYSLTGDYTGVSSVSMVGCSMPSSELTQPNQATGTGHINLSCNFQPHAFVSLAFQGVGRTVTKNFRINCGFEEGDLALNYEDLQSAATGDHTVCTHEDISDLDHSAACGPGQFIVLVGTATRTCHITQSDGSVSTQKVPWNLNSLEIRPSGSASCGDPARLPITPTLPSTARLDNTGTDTTLSFKPSPRLSRNPDCHSYHLVAHDIGGGVQTVALDVPYPGGEPLLSVNRPDYILGLSDGLSEDWRFNFTANDASNETFLIVDDFCRLSPGVGLPSLFYLNDVPVPVRNTDLPNHEDAGGQAERAFSYPMSAASVMGNFCYHDSADGMSGCSDYHVNAAVEIHVRNLRSVEVQCCQYGSNTPTMTHPNVNGTIIGIGESFMPSGHCDGGTLVKYPINPNYEAHRMDLRFDSEHPEETWDLVGGTPSDATYAHMVFGTPTGHEYRYVWKQRLDGERSVCYFKSTGYSGATQISSPFEYRRPVLPDFCDSNDRHGSDPNQDPQRQLWWTTVP